MPPAANPSSSSSSSSSSSRWCPTPEQLMILEEMYRAGTRTPNAAQIQQITAHLSFYGKIEGKNVFYWFQNHKARDRQKLRRKLYKQLQQQQVLFHHHHMNMINMINNNHNINVHQNNHFLAHNSAANIESPFGFLNHPQQQQQLAGNISSQVQGTGVFEDHNHAPSSTQNHNQMMSYAWKMETPSAGGDQRKLDQKENSVMMMRSMYDRDWMMMLDHVGPLANNNNNNNNNSPSPCNTNNKPLKTLQLFPITATNLKEDCTTSSKHDHDDHDLSA